MSHLSSIPEEYQKEVLERRRISDLRNNLAKNAAILNFITSSPHKLMAISINGSWNRVEFELRNTADMLECANIDFKVNKPNSEIHIDKKFYDKIIKFKVINDYRELEILKRRTNNEVYSV